MTRNSIFAFAVCAGAGADILMPKGEIMKITPRLRKFVLTAHIISSVGWLGSVAAFLPLAIAGLASKDAHTVRGVYLAMELIGWYVIVPLCLASLATGLIQALGTQWGLFRHYWVLDKFLITLVSTLILFGFTKTLNNMGDLARDATLSTDNLQNPSPILHAGLALLALLVTATLSVYKPWGKTRYGRRKAEEGRVAGNNQDQQTERNK